MGIRVTAETLKQQLTMSKQLDFMQLPYHQAILNNQIPLSIGGGIGQSRTLMLLLRKAHLRRSQRHRVAEDPERDVRAEKYFRAGVNRILGGNERG